MLGTVIAPALTSSARPIIDLPINNIDTYDAQYNLLGGICANPMMEGTAGVVATGGSGQLATSWGGTQSSDATGVTRTYSKVTDAAGNVWQQCVLGGTATPAANALVDIARQVSLHTKLQPGLAYEAICAYEIDAGAANVNSLQLGLNIVASGFNTLLWDGDKYDAANPLPP
ncbi:hypothetical protein G3V96_26060, partial [Escherichia coli]|nr:hypothetical protein [Escherichia coli]